MRGRGGAYMTARQGLVTVASCPGAFKTSIVQRRQAGGKPVWAEQWKELQSVCPEPGRCRFSERNSGYPQIFDERLQGEQRTAPRTLRFYTSEISPEQSLTYAVTDLGFAFLWSYENICKHKNPVFKKKKKNSMCYINWVFDKRWNTSISSV